MEITSCTRMKLTSLLLLSLFCTFSPVVWGADPTLSPQTVTDNYKNVADSDSNITWGPLPQGVPYNASNTDPDLGGLGPLHAIVKGFLDVIQPNGLPYELINGVIANTFDISKDYMKIVTYGVGIAICFILGFLFVFIMPIVGCCFCCCRLCGNCGGRMLAKKDNNTNCKRIAFGLCLFVCTVAIGTSAACVYLTSEQIGRNIGNVGSVVEDNLGDLVAFLDNTINEVNYVATTNFNFTCDVIERDLDNIGYLVGIPVRDDLGTNAVDNAMGAILNLDNAINTVGTSLINLNTSIATLKSDGTTLADALAAVKIDVDSALGHGSCKPTPACTGMDTSGLTMDVDFSNLPDISTQVADMQAVQSQNLTAMAQEGMKQFTDIPYRVQNETVATVDSIKTMLNDFKPTITDALASIQDVPNMVTEPLDGVKKQISDVSSLISEYDQYRMYAGIGLAGMMLLVVLLQLLGLICGCCGHDKDTLPTQRGGLSHCGGTTLMASVGFIFIFSWLLMLLTSLTFVVGANLEKAACEPLTDPEMKIFSELLDKPGALPGMDGYLLGGLLLQNNSIPLTIAGVLRGCKENKAAYEVLKLNNLFDINSVIDYKTQIDIDGQLNSLNIDLSSVKIIDANTKQQVNDFKDALNIDFGAFTQELEKNTTGSDLEDFANALRGLSGTSIGLAKTKLNTAATDVDNIRTGIYQTVKQSQANLLDSITNLNISAAQMTVAVDSALAAADTAETYVQNNGSDLIKDEAKAYAARLLGIADSFASEALNAVDSEIGKCQPLYNVYDTLVDTVLCTYVVDNINAFWFSIGAGVFFMIPSLIFSVKLAKHFRKMKYMEDFDDVSPNSSPRTQSSNSNSQPSKFVPRNKVGHQDHYYGQNMGYA